MKNPTLELIKKRIVATFTETYGFCGLADGDNFAMINSGVEGESFIITIKDESAPAETTTSE